MYVELTMSQSTVAVYIPFLANVPKRGPCGGYGRLKRYVARAFARHDADGAMVLGTVKKVEIVMSRQVESDMSMDCGEKMFVASAFVKFVPSGTKACAKLMDEINGDEGLRFVHNTNKLLFWTIHRQRRQANAPPGSVCPLCGSVCQEAVCGTSRPREMDDVMAAFGDLTCDDEPGRKRMRLRA